MSASTSSAPPITSFASGDALIASMLAAERPRAARAAAAPAPAPAAVAAPAPSTKLVEASEPAAAIAPASVQLQEPAASIGDVIAAAAMRDVAPAAAVVDVPRKARRGRRRLAGDEKRGHCISVRVNAEEHKAIEAKRGKLPAGEFLRLAGMGFQPVPAVPTINAQAWRELSRVGSNLNQIAKHLNGSDMAREATQLRQVLDDLRCALQGATLPEPESPAA